MFIRRDQYWFNKRGFTFVSTFSWAVWKAEDLMFAKSSLHGMFVTNFFLNLVVVFVQVQSFPAPKNKNNVNFKF